MNVISLINDSTVLTDADVQAVVGPLQYQITRHFVPIWLRYAKVVFVPKGQAAPPNTWWLSVLDNSDQAGALGYHDVTPSGLPLGKVFAADDIKYGVSWTVTVSHETMEMLGDPWINLSATNFDGTRLYAYEACDACEADRFGYKVGGVLLSDFIYPAWFQDGVVGPYDYMRHISSPFQLLRGGYTAYMDLPGNGAWKELTADKLDPHIGHRMSVRLRPRGIEVKRTHGQKLTEMTGRK